MITSFPLTGPHTALRGWQSVLLTIIGCTLAAASAAVACSGGVLWPVMVGNFQIQITDDTPTIEPGQRVHFDYVLINQTDPAFPAYTDVHYTYSEVSLRQGDHELFFRKIPFSKHREQNGFDYTFPHHDASYNLTVRFSKDVKELAATTIPLTVGNAGTLLTVLRGPLVAIILIGSLSAIIFPLAMKFRS